MLKGLHNHWTKKGRRLMPKRAFDSEADAMEFMRSIYGMSSVYNVYLCADCQKYHIGHKMKQ
ncbi:MAG: hypothetical protein IKO46_06215 [Salinivirgaceae bacterium]|nr:hypothetical protein [Salinivirgaceae bacterium]MBR4620558.1 hypothetical protein [Salinivirgaceae bacterium]